MSLQEVRLDQLIEPAPLERAGNRDLPILSMTMHDGLIDQADKFKKRVASTDTAEYKLVRRNQLVVGFPIDEGVLSFQDLYDEAIVSPAYDTWNLRGDFAIEPAYLERFLRSPRALAFYRVKLRGTTARRRTLPDDLFVKLAVPLPPLAEQRRIVEILNKAEALRAKRRAALSQLDTLTQSIFLDMFGDPATNPMRWPTQSLGAVSERITKGESPKWQGFDYQDDGALFVTSENVRLGEIDLSEPKFVPLEFNRKLNRSELRPGDLLVNLVGASIGRSCVFPGFNRPANVNQAVGVVTIDNSRIEHVFVAGLLVSSHGQRLLLGNRVEAARANISLGDLSGLPLPIPPREMQRDYARRVGRVDEVKFRQRASAAELDALHSSLQHRAFRGEL